MRLERVTRCAAQLAESTKAKAKAGPGAQAAKALDLLSRDDANVARWLVRRSGAL
jgi:hypothetical protein